MVQRFWHKILGLFKKSREDFLIIEELDRGLEITEASVSHAGKEIHIWRRRIAPSFEDLRRPLLKFDRMVIGLNSRHATTIESVVRLKRSEPKAAISESEVDALVFKGLWEFLNHYRSWASKKMGINDLDLILADIEINDVRLGNHKVFNPLGFKAGDFRMSFRGTFIPRSFLAILDRFGSWSRAVQVHEGPSVLTAAISEGDDFAVHPDYSGTRVFSSRENERLCVKECPWGAANVTRAIAKHFGTDDEIAELILDRYNNRELSPRFERMIEKTFKEQMRLLFGMIEPICSRLSSESRPKVHVHFRFAVPPVETIAVRVKILPALFDESLRREGYNIITSGKTKLFQPRLCQNVLALLIYPHERPQYSFLNQLLKRRARWLIPHPSKIG